MPASSAKKQVAMPVSNPRRLPAHLSVSLRHDISPASPNPANMRYIDPGIAGPSRESPNRQESEKSGKSGESTVQRWFDHSNRRPETGYNQSFEDNEPPYFIPRNSSSTSNNDVPPPRLQDSQFRPGILQAATNASSAEDYRSVIDDLTVEIKKLKERLKRYERSQPLHLEKDKIFEVKIHGLPSGKRRELEEILKIFASSVDGSMDDETNISLQNQRLPYGSLNPHHSISTSNTKHTPASSTSNSRPNDSAYASMSASGLTSMSNLNQFPREKTFGSQPQIAKEQKIRSFLHNIPEGLFPRHSPVMTERQKKKIVVQRLEQLFTGKRGAKAGENSQPLQQQEVSKSAAIADQAAKDGPFEEEGVREANILPIDIDVDVRKRARFVGDSSVETLGSRLVSDSSDEQSPGRPSPKQRPTRPLDLDPDRAQIPSENVEYIRHLGLSTPKLITENSADAAADAEEWIYLNLLINMAQLHIINVTPEFVRSAVSGVSEKFQLSHDGKKVRWRGGSEGTHLSSDSGESSARNRSPQESDNGHGSRKRRKMELGGFASAPVEVDDSDVPVKGSGPFHSFHYKPLFHHQASSSEGITSTDESDAALGSGPEHGSGARNTSRVNAWTGVSGSSSKKRRCRDDGPIVFYSGAKFCTDLSGDRGDIITPLHVSGIGKDGYSNQALAALSSKQPAPALSRTTSGSLLPFQPFKDYSKGSDPFQTKENRPKTPTLFEDDSEDECECFVDQVPQGPAPVALLQVFEVSGLGGIQPRDHFAVQVKTRRRKAGGNPPRIKVSRFSRLTSPGKTPKKFLHEIPKKSIESFHDRTPEETITDRLAAWPGVSSPPRGTTIPSETLPIKTEILSTRYIDLEPSQLPPPLGWDATMTSSESQSSGDSSSGISRLRRDRTFLHRSHGSYDDRTEGSTDFDVADDSEEEDDESNMDTDSSIDMLAQARVSDPAEVAEQEFAFTMELDDGEGGGTQSAPLVRSSAATIDDESGYSSPVNAA